MEKTHWKKVVSDPNFLGEADFDENEEKIGTIAKVVPDAEVVTAEGKSRKAVVYFNENLKPMILNVARSKNIAKVAGSPYFEDWVGVPIQLYIEHGIKAFGDVVSAVRVRPRKPVQRNTGIKCTECGNVIHGAGGKSAEYIAAGTQKTYGVPLCWSCASAKAAAKATQPETEEAENGEIKADG